MKNLAAYIENADKSELRLILKAVEKKLGLAKPGADTRWLAGSEGKARSLNSTQLAALTASFSLWQDSAATPTQKRSRSRIWLAYLLLRYGALRLGEALALDDRKDIDFVRCQISIAGAFARIVQIPEDIMNKIAVLVEDPMFYSLRGEVLRIDQGYLRRKFYEQASLTGLPRELVNPRVIRQSRALELLKGGVPLNVVQSFTGQQSRYNNGGFGEISPHTGQRLVQDYLAREVKMKTSARNLFMGKVSRLAQDGLLSEVELTTLSGLKVVAMITEESFLNLRIVEGSVVTASVKAPWVVLLEPGGLLKSSARNQFAGKITAVKEGKLASEVELELYEGSKVCALVTEDSVKNTGLQSGKDMVVMFKAFSVILNAA